MAKRLVGLDFGWHGFHAVELFLAMGELRITRHQVEPLPEGFHSRLFNGAVAGEESETGAGEDPLVEFRDKLKDWFLPELKIYSAIPSEYFFNRMISFPFNQPKKINQLIRFEAEGYFPFSLQDYLLEHFTSGFHGKGTEVMAWALEQEKLKKTLERFNILGMDPSGIGIEGLCLSHLSMARSNGLSPSHAYLDIGARASLFVVIHANRPVLFRRIAFGGQNLTRAISEEFQLPLEQGEAGKVSEGLVLPDPEAEKDENKRRIALCLNKALEPLIHELFNIIHFHERFRMQEGIPRKIQEISLCGGTANLPGLADTISKELDIPTHKYMIPEYIHTDTDIPELEQPLLAEPLALAVQESLSPRGMVVNFRKGEFAYKSESLSFRKKLIFPALLLVALIVFSVMNLIAVKSQSQKEVKDIQGQMEALLKREIPGIAVVDPLKQVKQKLLEAQNRAARYENFTSATALQVLSEISDKMPEGISLEVTRFDYTEALARLEGETTGFQEAKSIVDSLSSIPFFEKVVLEDTRTGKEGKVRFVIQIPLKKEKITP